MGLGGLLLVVSVMRPSTLCSLFYFFALCFCRHTQLHIHKMHIAVDLNAPFAVHAGSCVRLLWCPPAVVIRGPTSVIGLDTEKKGVHQRKVCGPRCVQHPLFHFTDLFFIFTRQQAFISLGMQFRANFKTQGFA
ncbi:hypothetical protein TcG_11039 [Trypanosoma cruzi]|nr:hypothetical protein TcG_11039 [Trypanosoma cruzi]